MFEAHAQAVEAAATMPSQEFSFTSFIPLLIVFTILYFIVIRPQIKKQKEHQKMVNELKVGNKVVTSGGIVATVVKAAKDDDKIEIAHNVVIKILRSHVLSINEEKK